MNSAVTNEINADAKMNPDNASEPAAEATRSARTAGVCAPTMLLMEYPIEMPLYLILVSNSSLNNAACGPKIAAMQSRATTTATKTTHGIAVLTSGKNAKPQTIAKPSAHK